MFKSVLSEENTGSQTFEAIANTFHQFFTKQEFYKIGCALVYILFYSVDKKFTLWENLTKFSSAFEMIIQKNYLKGKKIFNFLSHHTLLIIFR